jgi:putative nucleotidyltransferase with HDIG domain
MDQEALQQFRAEVAGRRNLPTIPAVVTEVLSLVDGESTNARRLVEVVEKDQALTARTLRLANSAYFGQQRQVSTIPRAVMVLGFSTVRNLAFGVKVWESLGNGLTRKAIEELWAHAVLVAFLARRVAGVMREADPDECFTAGMVHDVGRVLIAGRFGDDYWKLMPEDPTLPLDVIERENLGIDHAEVGGWLLEAWNLPTGIVDGVRRHHDTPKRQGTGRVLGVTNRLVHLTDWTTGELTPNGLLLLESVQESGLGPDRWLKFVGEVRGKDALASMGNLGG